MSLRARMGLAAGVAVALAVIAVAVVRVRGTRSELRGQVDQSLQSLTHAAAILHPRPAPRGAPGSRAAGPVGPAAGRSGGRASTPTRDSGSTQLPAPGVRRRRRDVHAGLPKRRRRTCRLGQRYRDPRRPAAIGARRTAGTASTSRT